MEIKSDILNESYSVFRTESGLEIACYPMKGYNAVYAVFATDFGSVDRSFSVNGKRYDIPAGVAHFLEHKMFESEDGDAFDRYALTGANANAFTSFDKTCYIFTATENVDRSLDILLDFVTSPYFTQDTVNKEQGIIGQEIKMYDDSPNWRLLFGVLEGLYVRHPVRDDIAGTVESISQITPDMLYTVTKAFYSPSQMMLAVAGNVTPDQVKAARERAGIHSEELTVEKIPTDEPDEINYSEKTIKMSVALPMAAIGYKERVTPPVSEREELIGEIIMQALTGPTSELFNRLYDENIVNGTFEGEVFSGKDYYSMIISGESKDPRKMIIETENAVKTLKEKGISEDDFLVVKNSMYGDMIVDFEDIEVVANNIVASHFRNENLFSALETLSSITLEDVNCQLKTMFRDDKKCVFTIMPGGGDD